MSRKMTPQMIASACDTESCRGPTRMRARSRDSRAICSVECGKKADRLQGFFKAETTGWDLLAILFLVVGTTVLGFAPYLFDGDEPYRTFSIVAGLIFVATGFVAFVINRKRRNLSIR